MALESIEVAGDHSTVSVTTSLANDSGETLRIYELDTGLRLTGRAISADNQRFSNLRLEPGQSVTLKSEVPIAPMERSILDEGLDASGQRWNVEGRILVEVEDLTESVWLPYRFDREID